MIQRIQTLYLFLTTLLSFLFLKGNVLNFIDKSGTMIKVTFNGIYRDAGGESLELIGRFWPLSAIIILVPVLSVITIFLFKNRKIQLWFAFSGILLAVGFVLLSIYYSYTIIHNFGTQIVPGYKMLAGILLFTFNYLAYRGIRKDDDLVKSYDRLR
jgi:hypothetical protein